jgi:hypothetical protein
MVNIALRGREVMRQDYQRPSRKYDRTAVTPVPATPYSGCMHDFFRAFTRNPDGSWTCLRPATIAHPAGRIQVAEGSRFYPGTSFMGVDLARWLEEHCAPQAAAVPEAGRPALETPRPAQA